MSRAGKDLPPGYQVVHAAGLHDVAIGCEAKVELVKATKHQRCEIELAIQAFALGERLPTRLGRIATVTYPSNAAPKRVELRALTAHGITAFGVFGTDAAKSIFYITGFDLRDASAKGERGAWVAAGNEALRIIHGVGEIGGSHDAVSAAR